MRTTKVIDGKLCIEQDGVKFWFTLTFIDRHIARLEKELREWRERRLTVVAGDTDTPALVAEVEQLQGVLADIANHAIGDDPDAGGASLDLDAMDEQETSEAELAAGLGPVREYTATVVARDEREGAGAGR